MTDKEKELVKNYPEAAAFAGAARGQEDITPDDFAPDLWSASPLS